MTTSSQYRLVVASANKTALEALGTTASNEPLYGLLVGQGTAFAAGATLKRQINFRGERGQLISTLRLERAIPAPPNQPPTANAGPAQTLTLTSGQTTLLVTLDASASSDPDGSIAADQWTDSPQPAPIAQPQVALPSMPSPLAAARTILAMRSSASSIKAPTTSSISVAERSRSRSRVR